MLIMVLFVLTMLISACERRDVCVNCHDVNYIYIIPTLEPEVMEGLNE